MEFTSFQLYVLLNLRPSDRPLCLQGADLIDAYLPEADLSGANLRGANLEGAYLSGAAVPAEDLPGDIGTDDEWN